MPERDTDGGGGGKIKVLSQPLALISLLFCRIWDLGFMFPFSDPERGMRIFRVDR